MSWWRHKKEKDAVNYEVKEIFYKEISNVLSKRLRKETSTSFDIFKLQLGELRKRH